MLHYSIILLKKWIQNVKIIIINSCSIHQLNTYKCIKYIIVIYSREIFFGIYFI